MWRAKPDSVKQARWDARQARRDARRLPTKPWAEQGTSPGFRLIVQALLIVGAIAVAAIVVALALR